MSEAAQTAFGLGRRMLRLFAYIRSSASFSASTAIRALPTHSVKPFPS